MIVALLLAAWPVAALEIVGRASVIDGDTIEIHGKRIRLFGIDAIESHQSCVRPSGASWRCGRDAAIALSDMIGTSTVSCQVHDTDRYGRAVSVCSTDADLNERMVRQGWAVAYRRYSSDYIAAEDDARRALRGIWAASFDWPWDWRKHKRTSE